MEDLEIEKLSKLLKVKQSINGKFSLPKSHTSDHHSSITLFSLFISSKNILKVV